MRWLQLYRKKSATFNAAKLLAEVSGSDDFQFVTVSDGLPGIGRKFSRFSDAAREAGMSRIYGGIHFPAANEQGLESGRRIGLHVVRTKFRPIAANAGTPAL